MMKPGKYWVGDLCYVMHEHWDEVCDLMFPPGHRGKMREGVLELSNGLRFAVHGTKHGDGTYNDEAGRKYDVDSGSIGCIAIEHINLAHKDNDVAGGNVVEFKKQFTTDYDDGILRFGHVHIDTRYQDEYDGNYHF